jgi:hypothetical protein
MVRTETHSSQQARMYNYRFSQFLVNLKTQLFTKILGIQIWYLSKKLTASEPNVDQILLGCLWSMGKIKEASPDLRVRKTIEVACQDVYDLYRNKNVYNSSSNKGRTRSVKHAARGLC